MIKENQLQIELNVVLTKYNKDEIPQLIGFCQKHNISAKFFEHVNVLSFGKIGQKANIISDEIIPFNTFHNIAIEVLNSDVSVGRVCDKFVRGFHQAAALYSQKSSQSPLRMQQRRAIMPFAPLALQCIPDCFNLCAMMERHPASITPEPTKRPSRRYRS